MAWACAPDPHRLQVVGILRLPPALRHQIYRHVGLVPVSSDDIVDLNRKPYLQPLEFKGLLLSCQTIYEEVQRPAPGTGLQNRASDMSNHTVAFVSNNEPPEFAFNVGVSSTFLPGQPSPGASPSGIRIHRPRHPVDRSYVEQAAQRLFRAVDIL